MKLLCPLYFKAIKLSNITLSPLLDLAIRLFMANIFFKSGWLRLQDFLNGQWSNQITAFRDYHPIPGINPEIAAVAGTGAEIILPVLLVLGLLTRVSAAGLLVMTMSIQFLVPADYGVANNDHYMWMLLLAVPMLKGAGMFSADFLICRFGRRFCGKK